MVKVDTHNLGAGNPCLLIAEIGINHNGDVQLAKRMIDAAVSAGADAVKFQSFRTEDFIADRTLTYEYSSKGRRTRESQYDMFKRCELTPEDLLKLRKYADRRGVIFFSTPTSESGVAELARMGVVLLKNGSDFLTHLPLIRAMARSGLPTALSTGMATLAEIDEAVRAFRSEGNDQLILFHCTSAYPTPPQEVHLRKIPVLAAAFRCPVGLSDHTEGITAAIGAVVLGACCIEKHFTIDKKLPGPDHQFSADGDEFAALVEGVRSVEKCLGSPSIEPTPLELSGRQNYRLSCVAARSLAAKHKLTEPDLSFHRPGTGHPPAHSRLLVRRVLKRNVEKGHIFDLEDFE